MQKSVDDVIGGALMHTYDPVKAHEYYMKTRHLKGRHHNGNVVPLKSTKKNNASHKVPPELEARIKQLESRLSELRAHLSKLLESKRKKGSSDKPKTHETQAEKQKRAADAKKYREHHKSEIAKQRKKAAAGGGGGSTPVADMTETQLREAIKTTLVNLHAAVAKARAAANRGTA